MYLPRSLYEEVVKHLYSCPGFSAMQQSAEMSQQSPSPPCATSRTSMPASKSLRLSLPETT